MALFTTKIEVSRYDNSAIIPDKNPLDIVLFYFDMGLPETAASVVVRHQVMMK